MTKTTFRHIARRLAGRLFKPQQKPAPRAFQADIFYGRQVWTITYDTSDCAPEPLPAPPPQPQPVKIELACLGLVLACR